jgi:hypothetical protein
MQDLVTDSGSDEPGSSLPGLPPNPFMEFYGAFPRFPICCSLGARILRAAVTSTVSVVCADESATTCCARVHLAWRSGEQSAKCSPSCLGQAQSSKNRVKNSTPEVSHLVGVPAGFGKTESIVLCRGLCVPVVRVADLNLTESPNLPYDFSGVASSLDSTCAGGKASDVRSRRCTTLAPVPGVGHGFRRAFVGEFVVWFAAEIASVRRRS